MIDNKILTFLKLCKNLNYTKTAKDLNLTQPAISQQIKALEKEYAVKLFNYKEKTLTLTSEGEMLRRYSVEMVANNKKIKENLDKFPKENKNYSIGATLTIGEYIMTSIIKNYLKNNPSANIKMYVENTETLLKKLENGTIDAAIIEGSFEKNKYNTKLFKKSNFIGVASNKSKFSNKSLSFDDLVSETLIIREKGSGTRAILLNALENKNINKDNFKSLLEIGNFNAIKNLVENNFGITFLYEEVVERELKDKKLVKLNIKDFNLVHDFNIASLKNKIDEKNNFLEIIYNYYA